MHSQADTCTKEQIYYTPHSKNVNISTVHKECINKKNPHHIYLLQNIHGGEATQQARLPGRQATRPSRTARQNAGGFELAISCQFGYRLESSSRVRDLKSLTSRWSANCAPRLFRWVVRFPAAMNPSPIMSERKLLPGAKTQTNLKFSNLFASSLNNERFLLRCQIFKRTNTENPRTCLGFLIFTFIF